MDYEKSRGFCGQGARSSSGLSVKGHLTQVSKAEGQDEIVSLHELSGKYAVAVSSARLADLQAMPEKK